MADSNDDLLEDGDLSETNFEELDLAEEDALLADDGDEKPIKSTRNEGEKTTQEDDDYLDLGVVDEDLTLNDEEVVENGTNVNKKRTPIEFNSHDNDDSDDNSGGERARFKSERQIIARSSTAIPETLDAVAVRNPLKFNRGGFRGGKGGRGGNNRKFHRNQPTNIHVNPHFRPRVPMGRRGLLNRKLPARGPQMWNGGFQGPQSFQPPHPPYGYQPPMQQPQWNDQGYFMPPGPPSFNPPPVDNNYYGPPQDFYPHQAMPPNYPQPPPQPQMGWGDPSYFQGGPPQNFPPPHFQHGPGPQMPHPRMRPPFNPGPRPPNFNKNQNKHFNVKHHQQGGNQQGWSGNVRPQKRDQFHAGKVPPLKQQRFDNSSVHRVRSNLQEVKMVDCLPAEALAEEEDEEMKAYRKKIEEQKKLREQLLRQKEENRMVAVQQKRQESARLGLRGAALTPANPINNDGPPGVTEEEKKIEYKMVRVRTGDGKTVVKKMTLEEIKKLKKLTPGTPKGSSLASCGVPSCVVSVENLSASTTQKQLEDMAGQVGPIEKVELDSERNTAIIKFTRLESAKDFVSKYQRKMVDLSMIGVKFLKEE